MDFIQLDENGNPIEYEDVYSDSSKMPGNNKVPQEDDERQNNEDKKSKKKRKKKKSGLRLIKHLVLICVALALVSALVTGISVATSGYTHKNIESNKYVSFTDKTTSPLVSNILLIGADGEDGGSQRSDTMMLVSIDYAHGTIKLTSFLRDCWVYIPNKDKYAKLNAAYSYGGAQYVNDTIEYNFGIDIDHYVKVDFEMFTEIIDKIGGIDIEVTESEAAFINKTTRYTVESGENVHLDGAKALVYCRIRKLDSDYMRTYRQRKVINAIINKAKKSGMSTIIYAAKEVLPMLETDLNAFEMTLITYTGGFAALTFETDELRIPSDDMMTTGYKGDQWVEIPDLDKCKEALKEFIYPTNIMPQGE